MDSGKHAGKPFISSQEHTEDTVTSYEHVKLRNETTSEARAASSNLDPGICQTLWELEVWRQSYDSSKSSRNSWKRSQLLTDLEHHCVGLHHLQDDELGVLTRCRGS